MTSAINALVADGNTVIPAGLLWGWRVLSQTVPFTQGAPYDDEKWIKALVLLTDGENMVSGGSNGFNESVYNAFGYAKNGHLGNKNGSEAEANLNDKMKQVCQAISKPAAPTTRSLSTRSASKSATLPRRTCSRTARPSLTCTTTRRPASSWPRCLRTSPKG